MAQKPKVALVHDHLVQDGGAERVLRVLMKLYPKAPVYTAFYDPAKMGPDFADCDIRTSFLQGVPGLLKRYKVSLPLLHQAFKRFDLRQYDVVISSASGWAKSVKTGPRTLHICYCHTPIRYIWSDSDRYIAETGYPLPVKWLIKLIRPTLRRNDRRGAAGIDAFVANSQHVAKRIRQYYDREAVVIYPPVETEGFGPAQDAKDYFLVAGRLEPYKRIDIAIAAANVLKVPLQVMGDGTDRPRLEGLAGPTITFLGRVSDARRQALFAEARAFINPQEEDFGITTVEALASGTPVIAYSVGGASEIIRPGQDGLLFSPQTTEGLRRVLREFDRARFKPSALRARARQFSSARFSRQLSDFVDRTYSQKRSG